MREPDLTTRSRTPIDGVQKLLDLLRGNDAFLDLAAREVELVSPVRHAGFNDGGEGGEGLGGGPVGRADGEEVGDEGGVPEGGAVGDCASLFS